MDIKELEKQCRVIDSQIKKYYQNEVEQAIAANKGYIGNTYMRCKDGHTTYYQIIDVDKDNQYRMNTLCFSYPIDFSPLEEPLMGVDSIGWFCSVLGSSKFIKEIDKYTEIPKEEFNEKLSEWMNEVKRKIDG